MAYLACSWGYLFQLAMLDASNVRQLGVNGGPANFSTPFSFQDPDLNADFYSYSAFALANNNRSAMLDADILTNVSQHVFTTFFQNFICLNNSYHGFWA